MKPKVKRSTMRWNLRLEGRIADGYFDLQLHTLNRLNLKAPNAWRGRGRGRKDIPAPSIRWSMRRRRRRRVWSRTAGRDNDAHPGASLVQRRRYRPSMCFNDILLLAAFEDNELNYILYGGHLNYQLGKLRLTSGISTINCILLHVYLSLFTLESDGID